MNAISSVQAWAIILGLITPLVTAVVKRPGMSKQAVQIISLAVAVVIGTGNLIVQGLLSNIDWSVSTVVASVVAVIGASQAAYALLWKPTGVEPAIDSATSPPRPMPQRDADEG